MRLTHHAVEQFATRYGGSEPELRDLVASAVPTKLRTPKGQEIWLCGERHEIRLVIKRDSGKREPICVTVLPPQPAFDPTEPGVALEDLVVDLPSSPVIETVPNDDAHLLAAAAEVDEARADTILASELYSATRSFLLSAKTRLAQAKQRLLRLDRRQG